MSRNEPPHSPSFASDVLKLVGGTAFAQALAVMASPILTRLYGPEAFGIAALFTSITGLIGVVACLRYEMAIMLPKKDETAANLLGLSLIIAASISILLVPTIWIVRDPLLRLLNALELAPYMWLVPLAVFLSGIFLALNYWNSRTKRFGRLSIARINASIGSTGTQLVAGLAGYSTGGSLIGAGIIGSAISTMVLGGQIWRDDHKIFEKSISLRELKAGLLRYKQFPIFDIWSSLLNFISLQLPIFMLSVFFTPMEVGYYAICNRLLFFPSSLIGTSISQVFFQRSSVANLDGNLSLVVEATLIRLISIGLYPFLLLSLIGQDLFIIVFGLPWAEAGVYTQILSLWTLIVFISSPMSILLIVREKQRIQLIFNVFFISTRFLSLYIGGLLSNVRLALILFASSGIILIIIKLFYTLNIINVSITRILRKLLPYFIYSIIATSLIIIIKENALDHYLILAMGFITAILYFILIYIKDDLINNYINYHIGLKK